MIKKSCEFISRLLTPKMQLRLAWGQLVISIIGWPLSLWLVHEPVIILSLSWWAVIGTALNYISSAEANVQVSDKKT